MSRKLTSIEINGTFYRGQSRDSYAKWRDETPDGFVFALKGSALRHPSARAGRSRRIDRALRRAAASPNSATSSGRSTGSSRRPSVSRPTTSRLFSTCCRSSVDGKPLRHAVEVAARQLPLRGVRRAGARQRRGDRRRRRFRVSADRRPDRRLRLCSHHGDSATASRRAIPPPRSTPGRNAPRAWAAGGAPKDLPLLTKAPAASGGREVFLYVISGFKTRNPAAAMALIERMR